jgi:hypothetical protein
VLKTIRRAVKRVAKAIDPNYYDWDMSSKQKRVRQVREHYEEAKEAKEPFRNRLETNEQYYRGEHDAKKRLDEFVRDNGMNMEPPVLPDPYIQVEGQIDDVVPTPQFSGRDNVTDPQNAKIREDVVKFIWYDNHLEDLNLENERSLMMSGNAFFKLAWDAEADVLGPGGVRLKGRIEIGNPDPANIFPDPTAYRLEDCEYLIHAYRMHRRKARRKYGRYIDKIAADGDHSDTEIYDDVMPLDEDTVLVLEYWYRDDEGDIALSVVIGQQEVKHVPKFWAKTRLSGCKMFPFVHYRRIPIRKNFWGYGEIDTIKDLVDAADRTLNGALLNEAFVGNDIVVIKGSGLADGAEPDNTPGAIWWLSTDTEVKRLGGIANSANASNLINMLHEKIEETNGNYVSAQGKEPVRVTTASGIAQLNERADKRQGLKKAGRLEGYRRLAQLTDWMALEFYDEQRLITIRGEDDREMEIFDPSAMALRDPMDPTLTYFPTVDVEVTVGQGIKKSKAFTLAATQELAAIQVTPGNYMIVKSIVELLDLPNQQDIMESIDATVQMQMQMQMQQMQQQMAMQGAAEPGAEGSPEQRIQAMLEADPELAQVLAQLPPEAQEQVMAQAFGRN